MNRSIFVPTRMAEGNLEIQEWLVQYFVHFYPEAGSENN